MTTDPYDQETDREFNRIIKPHQGPEVEWIDPASDEAWNAYITQSNIGSIEEIPNPRHPGGRTMNQPPRTSRDQATLLLGCGGFLLMLSLAVAVIIVAWRW